MIVIDKANLKTSAVDAIWSTAIYFGFRKFYSGDLALNLGDAAVVLGVVSLIFIAGVVTEPA